MVSWTCPYCGKSMHSAWDKRTDSEGWEHEFPTIFGKEEKEKWQENSRQNSYDKFGQKKDGRHL